MNHWNRIEPKQAESNRTGKILIIEHDPAFAEIMAEDLRDLGYTVFSAPTGDTALGVLESYSIDLVISDGTWILDRLRERGGHVPVVVVMTGMASFDELDEFDAIVRGAHCVLKKPLDREELCEVVDDALDQSRHERRFLHELSVPLSSALFILDVLGDELVGEGEGEPSLARLHQALEKLRQLIEDRAA